MLPANGKPFPLPTGSQDAVRHCQHNKHTTARLVTATCERLKTCTLACTHCLSTAGHAVMLVREPHNPHDPNALAVLTLHGHGLGYIPREQTFRIPQQVLMCTASFWNITCKCGVAVRFALCAHARSNGHIPKGTGHLHSASCLKSVLCTFTVVPSHWNHSALTYAVQGLAHA